MVKAFVTLTGGSNNTFHRHICIKTYQNQRFVSYVASLLSKRLGFSCYDELIFFITEFGYRLVIFKHEEVTRSNTFHWLFIVIGLA